LDKFLPSKWIGSPGEGPPGRGQFTLDLVEVVDGQADLPIVISASSPIRRFTNHLYGRQEQADQNRNDGDDDEQFE
jgi:hypothetical protein